MCVFVCILYHVCKVHSMGLRSVNIFFRFTHVLVTVKGSDIHYDSFNINQPLMCQGIVSG